MTAVALLATLVALINLFLYIRANAKLRVLRSDVRALAAFAEAIVSPRKGG